MSSQIQITGETKVKSLTGVLTGTSGVVGFLPIDVSLGIPQLDVNGKILVSQLPNSVMEYKGTWSAATNTPTLANGTGNQGDVYLCDTAGTVNFGAGPIAFFVGDQVIYSGSIWQRASGATGTVTSVAVTESGDSLNITGSPITTSGTINIGFNGTNLQYVNGAGNLTTFPILTGYVTAVSGTAPVVSSGGTTPAISMAAATGSVDGYLLATDFAIFNAKQSALTFSSPLINTSGTISIPAATTSVNGYLASADFTTFNNKQNAITLTTTGSSGVSTLVGATLNIPDYGSALTGYVTLATTQTITGAKTFSGYTTFTSTVDITSGLTFSNSGFTLLLQPPTLSVNRTVTLPNATGTLALTSDISYPVSSVFGRTGAVVATNGDYTTAQVTESGNLYFTDSRARLALSGSTGISYNNTTGVITNAAPDQVVALTASTGISISGTYPNFTITNTSPSSGGTVTSVAALTIGTTGTDLSSTVANSTTTPVITLNVPTASATNRGALSSADWTTFNNKQSALTNPVTGTGTTNYLPKFTGTSTIGNSAITDDGTTVTLVSRALSGTSAVFSSSVTANGILQVKSTSSSPSIWAGGYGGGITILADNATSNRYLDLSIVDSVGAIAAQGIRITSGGNVLIGTTTDAGYKLDVNGTGRFSGTLSANELKLTGASAIQNTTTAGYIAIYGNTGGLYLGGFNAGANQNYQFINASTGVSTFTVSGNDTRLANFSTVTYGSARGLRINSYQSSNGGQDCAIEFDSGVAGYGGFKLSNSGTPMLTLLATGAATFSSTCTATGFFESSDSRLKTLIQDNYQTKGIASITPKLYTKNGKVELGYYAQDFVGVLDSAVSKGSDDMLSLSYREVHTAKIYALEQEIKELKAKLN